MHMLLCNVFFLIRCRTPDGTRPRRGPAAAATKIDIGSGTETESEGENLDTVAHPRSLLAVNVRGEEGDTGRMEAMHAPGGNDVKSGKTNQTCISALVSLHFQVLLNL